MKKVLSNKEIFSILYCMICGYGILNLPKLIAQIAGTGGWISLLIGAIAFMLLVYPMMHLQYVYEGMTIYEYSQKLIGKFLTYIFIGIYIMYFFTYFTTIIRMYGETMKLLFLTKTPVKYICLLFYIVVWYSIFQGLNGIAKLSEIYGIISIISMIAISTILYTQGKFINVRPLFVLSNSTAYIKALIKIIPLYTGIEIIYTIPMDRDINKGIVKKSLIFIAFIGILYVYIIEATFSIGGLDLIINSEATLFSISKGIDIPFLEFFRRPDGIYIMIWTTNIVCGTSMWGYGTVIFINKIFKNASYKIIVIIVVIMSFTFSRIPYTTKSVQKIVEYNSYIGIVVLFIHSWILILMTKVKGYDKK